MNDEKYKKLNDYLNCCFKQMERYDSFLLRNIEQFAVMSEKYTKMISKYDVSKQTKESKNLTFEDVYLLAREIIEDINPSYLEEYDKIISNGTLDFSYTNEHYVEHFVYIKSSDAKLINMNRQFNYCDVSTLVHEFMHMTNHSKNVTSTRYMLTEFISIYFEEYAKNYLLKKGIPKDELEINGRMRMTKTAASNFNWYSSILIAYEKIGRIDEETYLFLNEYYLPITQEEFENKCKVLLYQFLKAEINYKKDIKYEKQYDENELSKRLLPIVNTNYRFILGTLLAFYTLKYLDKDKMLWLNDHVNDGESVYDILCTIGIDLDEIHPSDLINIIENRIKENHQEKNR